MAITVGTSATVGVQALASSGEGQVNNYLVSNATAQACFIGVGPDAVSAAAAAVVPVPGAATPAIYLQPNSTQSFTLSPRSWFSTIAPTSTTTVYITPGDGL